MTEFDIINDIQVNGYSIVDNSDIYDDSRMGNKLEDFEILLFLGKGAYGRVYKVRSNINKKIYAMKILDLKSIKQKSKRGYELALHEAKFLESLSHPHIIKYYKNFRVDDIIYIIIDYMSNGSMEEYINAHKKMKRSIPEEDLWNFFLQCMWSLAYIHSKGIVHRDIKLDNLLLDNNMKIKLGDFGICGLSFDESNKYSEECYLFLNGEDSKNGMNLNSDKDEESNGSHKCDQKNDVYYMGVCFYKMCHFCHPKDESNNQLEEIYSEELENIIKAMLKEDSNKRGTSEEIYKKIMNEYSKKYNRNTSIDSVFKCLNSFNCLSDEVFRIDDKILKIKPFTKMYVFCLKFLKNEKNLSYYLFAIEHFKKMLVSSNLKIEGNKEVNPIYIIGILFEKMHKELNNNIIGVKKTTNLGEKIENEINEEKYNLFNMEHLINSKEELNGTNEIEVRLKFINETLSKINSPISNNFKTLKRIENTCKICNNITYIFNCYFFITIDIDKIFQIKNFSSELNLLECLTNTIITKKEIYCCKCLKNTLHKSEEQTFSFPKLIIIYIDRGANFKYKTKVSFKEEIELYDTEKKNKKKYHLVGLIKRKNNIDDYFSITNINLKWFLSDKNKILTIKSISDSKEGDIIVFFYQELDLFKEDENYLKNI